MRSLLIALALLCAATPAFAQKGAAAAGVEDQVVGYHDTDARMNGAIEQARATLPRFLEIFRGSNGSGAFTVKVAMATSDGGLEHIWAGELRFEGEQLVGELINEPHDLPNLRLGSRVVIPVADISDWSIATPEGLYCAFTTRVMLEDMPTAEAERYRRELQLAPSPLPRGWTQ